MTSDEFFDQFHERLNRPLDDPFAPSPVSIDVSSVDYHYSQEAVLALVKKAIADPDNQPRWAESDFSGAWVRPISGHHFVALHLLTEKPWDHSLAAPSPRFLAHHDSMNVLAKGVEQLLCRIIAKDILRRQLAIETVPDYPTTLESRMVLKTYSHVKDAVKTNTAVVTAILSKLPDQAPI